MSDESGPSAFGTLLSRQGESVSDSESWTSCLGSLPGRVYSA